MVVVLLLFTISCPLLIVAFVPATWLAVLLSTSSVCTMVGGCCSLCLYSDDGH